MADSSEYSILLSDDALSQLRALDKSVQERIKKRLAKLAVLPPARTLAGFPNRWVLDIGDYRALYFIDEKNKAKVVAFIGDHKAYQHQYEKMFGRHSD